jgi:probable HAF family extracellular repeat protein
MVMPDEINNRGQVVGAAYSYTLNEYRPMLWENGQTYDLNDLIDPASKWSLLRAYHINNLGQILAFGIYGGQDYSVLLTPIPEPATAVILLCIAGASLRRRRIR